MDISQILLLSTGLIWLVALWRQGSLWSGQKRLLEAERTLKEREDNLHLSQTYGGIGTWEADLINNRQIWSETVTDMMGFPKLSHPTWEDFLAAVHPEDREILIEGAKATQKYDVEYRIIDPSGQIRWMRSVGLIERDAGGVPYRMKGIVQEITDRKLAELALRESEARFRHILESSPIAVRIAKLDTHEIVFANRSYLELLDIKDDYSSVETLFNYHAHQNAYQQVVRELEQGHAVLDRMLEITIPGIGSKWVLASYLPLQYRGEATILGWLYDITERRNMEEALRQSEKKLRGLFELSPLGIALNDMNGRFIEFNDAFLKITGYNAAELKALDYWQLTPEKYRTAEAAQLQALAERGHYGPYEKEYMRKDKSPVPVKLVGMAVNLAEGQDHIWSIVEDITEAKQTQKKLVMAAQVFSEAHEGIAITDPQGTIIDVNPTFCEISGYGRDEIIGHNSRILQSGKHSHEFYTEMWQTLIEHGHWQGELWNRKKSGEIYAELLTISALRDTDGNVVNYVGLFADITQIKHQQQRLEMMAHYDILTGLPNRVLFGDRFQLAVARSKRNESLLGVCYLDLDGFKPVNDSLGHDAGDRLLIDVAARIKSVLREEDTLSRLGGDEFALLINDLDSLEQCRQTLDRVLQTIAKPYSIDNQHITIGASIGFTLYPLDPSDPDTLLRHADQAMYQAKSEGRNRFNLFDAEQDQNLRQQLRYLQEIEAALARQEFCLYYQPKVNMLSGEVIGAEALIRWLHPQKGLVPPGDFLPVVSGTHLESLIGDWVVEQALKQLDVWQTKGLAFQISVNIAPQHLQQADFLSYLGQALRNHANIPPSQLQLEMLESSVLDDLAAITQTIQTCREQLGVSVALDDFGTGYSSLTHLRHLPVEVVKIDQSFVRNMITDPNDSSIVQGVIGLASAFHREVIAEGVETHEHVNRLLEMGCVFGQGYGIARPMPADALASWVAEFRRPQQWHSPAHAIAQNSD